MASMAVFPHEDAVRNDRRGAGIETVAAFKRLRQADEIGFGEELIRLVEHVALPAIGRVAQAGGVLMWIGGRETPLRHQLARLGVALDA